MIRIIIILAAICVLFVPSLLAQNKEPEVLRLDEAIRIGLENNFSIRIARNVADIAENNQSYGNAGFFPELSATASRTKRIEDSKTEFSGNSIPDRDVDGAETTTTNASASLNWTIFDGLGMFTTYQRLSELKELGAIESRLAIENRIAQIITAYFNIVRQKKIADVLESTLELSEQRIQIAETRKDLGSGSEYDLLQARADYNADRAAMIRQEITLHDAKLLLNELMGRDVDQQFAVQADIPVNQELEYEEIVEKALSDNLQLAVAKTNERVTELEIKEIKAERFPELDLNVGYGYNLNESGAGFLELSQSTGFNYGLTARITLFDGFNRERRRQNAQIALKNQRLSFQEQQQQVKAGINSEFNSYLNALRLVKLEEENLVYAEQTVDIALERFKLGTINSIELREAQRTLIDAESRLIQARFEAKAAETELYRLMGIVTEQAAD
ncbi:TolC family protein [Aliifodinibius sp. S!AR15-10]|uniref:TolC family protein n=1 Tax=Aliifodinibius sp. S!AR15-10 TaxID=2950437 RepID=UPI0028673E8B|nr:TolC family protein [Aliifodinibius sp. S!AR15-10]MDR8392770.1 TolC family protein [Aliifodinibius sp. S!AR15-10]